MRKGWLVLIMLMAGTASAVPVWKWVDEHGVTHYSDRPVEGAERVELSAAQSFPAQRPSATPLPSPRPHEAQPAAQPARYHRFEVVRPAQQETLWNIGGSLNVEIALDPALDPGHQLDVYLDGERRNLAATSTTLQVPGVHRGVHTLQAVILDANGNELLRSLAVTFIVQQTSIQNPHNPAPPARSN